ncbi:MAG: fructose-6-phosphate aldolase [Candidatus Magasanikbacteria bacterium RIFCSPHIGHO2_01_FULL_33_34]|uniref:Probable transaldolase n=1 Tax=Candidatus Magasanikbacteria bacterium RIFCSPHIGHO2_01_FULL_33_34 TaxID=1798671 RepID=A0A1F6LKL1_9BACT|nr:MAG: fructose-6-phosphate aldolase [Candidatus Magasanikbacteria bacterium RIFCSPHIGHO2_01_FULL_33_34]OGH65628.1 MAG: fructose-6-phosphate aldolase [Candidatus Magasanikbacteria bacterium RIFCSPHIGHO2_02_FULL_33_17]OGH75837.1 MAG: fructose-6-phosphate aldolase [Candidatus Magasanikbacteria bacterium RIFCSPLOWO2_01_FULL_33_34]OGH81151.1 MAG: fructose-6-phosphate aldolase [Candidatus Magasanikbacteria bacterium RIFCSPLOWO2_12_FULL_34_7]
MKFFIDTANIEEIKKYATLGMLDGVTTNPSLLAKEGVNFEKRIKEILKVVKGPVSVEVIATDTKGMIKEGKKYATWGKNVYVKVPCTFDGLSAVRSFSKESIKTNVTLVFSANQALLAAKAGATLVSPFVGRLDDIGKVGMDIVAEMLTIFENYQLKTQVLVASIRSTEHVLKAAMLGAHIATIPAKILEELIKHPLTDKGLEKFLDDWNKMQKK